MQVVQLKIRYQHGRNSSDERYLFCNMQEAKKALTDWMNRAGFFEKYVDYEYWEYPGCIIANSIEKDECEAVCSFSITAEWETITNHYNSEFDWDWGSREVFKHYEKHKRRNKSYLCLCTMGWLDADEVDEIVMPWRFDSLEKAKRFITKLVRETGNDPADSWIEEVHQFVAGEQKRWKLAGSYPIEDDFYDWREYEIRELWEAE